MSRDKSGISIIILNVFVFIFMGLAVVGVWYHLEIDPLNYKLENDYDLYRVMVNDGDTKSQAFFVKSVDEDMSKLFIAIGFFQWLSLLLFIVAGLTFVHSYRHPECLSSLKANRGFTIAMLFFQAVAVLALLGFNPVFKSSINGCSYSPSPCSSFLGKYSTMGGEIIWRPSWGWASAVISSVFSFVVMILTVKRYKHIKHHHSHCHQGYQYHDVETSPMIGKNTPYYQPPQQPQQPGYYQPQQPAYYPQYQNQTIKK